MARMMLGIRISARIIIKKPNPMSSVTGIIIPTLVCTVMPFFFTKLSRCFLYIFVPTNQSWSFWDEFAKQNTVTRKKGTVGKIGSAMPTHPNPRQTNPKIKNISRFSFINSPLSFSISSQQAA